MLAHTLACDLAACHEGARRVHLGLYRVDGTSTGVTIGTSTPTRDPTHVLKLLLEKLGAVDAGFGIDVVTLEAQVTEPLEGMQVPLTRTLSDGLPSDPAPLIDRLSNRLGADRVLRFLAAASHWPERAQRPQPALVSSSVLVAAADGEISTVARPPILFARPEPVTVLAEVPEGPPVRLTWRRRVRRVVRAEGPERIAPEWWRDIGRVSAAEAQGEKGVVLSHARIARTRDYYRVEDEHGARFWVYREGLFSSDIDGETGDEPPRWFLHGVFP
jgi:protein ImuB